MSNLPVGTTAGRLLLLTELSVFTALSSEKGRCPSLRCFGYHDRSVTDDRHANAKGLEFVWPGR